MASSQAAKPRARRASRAPMGKSLSVDENVLSSTLAVASGKEVGFGRPSSMLARTSSSSGAVLNPQNAQGLTQRMKSASISSKVAILAGGDKLAGVPAASGPRRVLGDLSNANKQATEPYALKGKTGDPVKPAGARARSASTLSAKPLAPKSSAAVTNNTTAAAHSRTTSAASRHSVHSTKSSISSLHGGDRARVRTASSDAFGAAPGAPRIGSGSWTINNHLNHANGNDAEEVLDTVVEGDSYSGDSLSSGAPKHGLAIRTGSGISDEAMQSAIVGNSEEADADLAANMSSGSNETFELDLDAALVAEESAKTHRDEMDVDGDTRSSKKQKRDGPSGQSKPRDPENWLELRSTVKRDAARQLAEIQRDFRDDIDVWDTSMVAEYSEDIFAYMEQLEIESMPNASYMDAQTEIEWPMRATLIDWLLQVHMRYHMLPETLWITINIVDRFLSNRVVSLVKLQLVGITAMFVAAKYEEIMAPSVDEFVYMTENNYSREEILKGERIILQSLDFGISKYCSPYSWVRRISKADDYDIQTRTLSKFLMEVTLLDHRFLRAKPSMIAAVGMYLARRMLSADWSDQFIFYSKYTEAELATPTSFILAAVSADDFEERFVYQKYSSKKFLKASIFARQWAKATLESATRAQELSMK